MKITAIVDPETKTAEIYDDTEDRFTVEVEADDLYTLFKKQIPAAIAEVYGANNIHISKTTPQDDKVWAEISKNANGYIKVPLSVGQEPLPKKAILTEDYLYIPTKRII